MSNVKYNVDELIKRRADLHLLYDKNTPEYTREYNKLKQKIRYWKDAEYREEKRQSNLEYMKNNLFGTDKYRDYQREYHRNYTPINAF